MPRRSSSHRSGGRSSPRPAASTPRPGRSSWSAPRPAASTPRSAPVRAPSPPPAPRKSEPRGLGSVVAEGMAFGVGNAIAHSLFGPRTIIHESVASSSTAPEASTMNTLGGSDPCGVQSKAFQDCLNNLGTDISKCQFYLDMLSECRKGSGAGLSVNDNLEVRI